MKLLTKEIKNKLPAIGSGDDTGGNRPVICKFFTPDANWTWYVLEGEELDGDVLFFGLVVGLETELGYFLLSQLQDVRGPLGLAVERDLYFGECTLAEAEPEYCARVFG